MGTSTPLLDRIEARRKVGRIGPVSPVPTERLSPFAKRLAEKRLPVHELYNGAFVPTDDRGAA